MKRVILPFLAAIFCFFSTAGYGATVMISHDLYLNVAGNLNSSSYITGTSIDLESGVMDHLFDNGHIVFNTPGQVYTGNLNNEVVQRHDVQGILARKSRIAVNGGADLFIYLRLYFNGENERSLWLSSLDYEVLRVRDEPAILAADHIRYDMEGGMGVNGDDAALVLVNRFRNAAIFQETGK